MFVWKKYGFRRKMKISMTLNAQINSLEGQVGIATNETTQHVDDGERTSPRLQQEAPPLLRKLPHSALLNIQSTAASWVVAVLTPVVTCPPIVITVVVLQPQWEKPSTSFRLVILLAGDHRTVQVLQISEKRFFTNISRIDWTTNILKSASWAKQEQRKGKKFQSAAKARFHCFSVKTCDKNWPVKGISRQAACGSREVLTNSAGLHYTCISQWAHNVASDRRFLQKDPGSSTRSAEAELVLRKGPTAW